MGWVTGVLEESVLNPQEETQEELVTLGRAGGTSP